MLHDPEISIKNFRQLNFPKISKWASEVKNYRITKKMGMWAFIPP